MFQNVYMNLLSPPQIAIWDQETSHYSEVVLRITIPVRGRKPSKILMIVSSISMMLLRITIPVRGRKLIFLEFLYRKGNC